MVVRSTGQLPIELPYAISLIHCQNKLVVQPLSGYHGCRGAEETEVM